MSGVEVSFRLTKREAEAVLRSGGFIACPRGYGVRKSQALQLAEMKIIGAVSVAAGGVVEP